MSDHSSLPRPWRAAIVAVLLLGVAFVTFVNARAPGAVDRLQPMLPVLQDAELRGPATPHPPYASGLDVSAVLKARRILPPGSRYYVHTPDRFWVDLRRAGHLYLTPSVATEEPELADWILSYRATERLRGIRVQRSYELGEGIVLAEVAR